jgi:hypothetical protein
MGPGSYAWVNCRRWWCEKHRAGHEEDMKPYTGARFRYAMSGAVVPVDDAAEEAERSRAEERAESLRRQREAAQAQRREDAERLAVYERARDEQWRREHISLPGDKP